MKTITLHISILAIFTLLSLNIQASTSENNKKSVVITTRVEELKETELNFEKWMTKPYEFNNSTVFSENYTQIEDWMKTQFYFSIENDNSEEKEIIIEDWMKNIFDFGYEATSFDSVLEIESWMGEIFK